ncbi:MAG: alpha/beta fold hydrolase [Gemmataceae bacterium]
MLVDLLRVQTRDGVFLDGMLQRPATSRAAAPQSVLMVHGTGGNFYGSTLFDFLGEKLLTLGFAVLRANTRGHDGVSTAATSKGGRRLGAAYETVDDCRHDLLAWTQWLCDNAGPDVLLLGHSLGAVKCLYAATHEPSLLGPSDAIVALSPPRLSYEWFCSGAKRDEFLATYQRAEERLRQNQPHALLEVTMPLPFVISAAGYVEKYGPDERYDFAKLLPGLEARTLFLFGAVETENNVAFQEGPALIEEKRKRYPNLDVRVIAGGDHFYTGVRDDAWRAIDDWLPRQRVD